MSDPDFWFDFEAASSLDLKAVGTFRYATDASTRAIVLAYAIGDGPALAWHADGEILDWDRAPDDLRAAFDRGGTVAAWHASFNAAVWNYATLGFPFLAPERVIDPMIQAGVSNLPTDLKAPRGSSAAQANRRTAKSSSNYSASMAQRPASIQRNGSAFSRMRARMSRQCATSTAGHGPCRLKNGVNIGPSNMSIEEV